MKSNSRVPGRTFFAAVGGVLRSPRWQRRVVWAVAAWLLLWALAYAAVPWILKSQLEKIGSEKLGRQLTLGAVDFKPWSLELTIHDLAIAKARPAGFSGAAGSQTAASGSASLPVQPPSSRTSSNTSALLKIKRLYIDAELQSLLRLAPVADAIVVEAPELSLAYLGDGRYDIDDILERLATPDAQPAGPPLKFALYNIDLSGCWLDFVDQSVHTSHELRDLHIAVPFLSNLASKREIKTTPHLAFKLNGSGFDTAAESTPFTQTRKTDADVTLRTFDLKPYLAYLPASLTFRLQSAVLNVDAKVAFEQTPATAVRISGAVTADKVSLLDTKAPGHELLKFDRLQLTMDELRPLEQLVKLSAVELTGPTLSVTRDRAGQLNLLPAATQSATKNVAANARPESATGQKDAESRAKAAVPAPWKVEVARVAVRGGSIGWLDETLPSPARIRLANMALDASAIAVPFAAGAPLQFNGSLVLDPLSVGTPADRLSAPALVTFKRSATDQAAEATAVVAGWPLSMAAKYIGQFLLPALQRGAAGAGENFARVGQKGGTDEGRHQCARPVVQGRENAADPAKSAGRAGHRQTLDV